MGGGPGAAKMRLRLSSDSINPLICSGDCTRKCGVGEVICITVFSYHWPVTRMAGIV
jgi:hypothetical protein